MPEEAVQQQEDPEPEGIVEIELPGQPGQKVKMAPVGVIAAERKRARETTEQKLRAEYEPYKQKAEQLETDLNAVRPQLDYVRQNWDTLQLHQQKANEVPGVSDEEAEKFARRYELFTAQGLDTQRAKQMIADNRKDTERIATEAAQKAIQPYAQNTATQSSRQNFGWAASQKDAQGNALVDPAELAQQWTKLPPELTANPQVAELLLEAAVGRSVRSGKRPQRSDQESVFSETPGGQRPQNSPSFGDRERRLANNVGMTQKQWTDSATAFKPGQTNVLGD